MKLNLYVGLLKGEKKSFSYFSFTGCNVSVAVAGSTSPVLSQCFSSSLMWSSAHKVKQQRHISVHVKADGLCEKDTFPRKHCVEQYEQNSLHQSGQAGLPNQ